ncbi:MAG TPA: glycoside hydrolase family 2, partial [Candidatus Dorea intestinavium]|nr:glycoside hydrolase family 2 [Candidatus Dorea intestinavium]
MKLETKWYEKAKDTESLLTEYPRPSLVRGNYYSLNGYWDYGITKDYEKPKRSLGKIKVPFSPETRLSKVERPLAEDECLWYWRNLTEANKEKGKRCILHFEAVDQFALVFLNGKAIKAHVGGYSPFAVEITEELAAGNFLEVMVRDLGASSYLARGKQSKESKGMFYTGQSGIWQSVWLEFVPDHYIEEVTFLPNYDKKEVEIKVKSEFITPYRVKIDGKEYYGRSNEKQTIRLQNDFHPWSPNSPYLYQVEVILEEDVIKTYFALRKVHSGLDDKGIRRVYLNNEPIFLKGVLNQGYWPEGLYTPPCDEAYVADIKLMKELGFNLMRMHAKVEARRFYYHCDQLGMLVWQDIVSGGEKHKSWYVTYFATAMELLNKRIKDNHYGLTGRKSEEAKNRYYVELKETINDLKFYPSIIVWSLFNEGWGQFDAIKIEKYARYLDDTRLIEVASGWFDQGNGDFRSIHNYFFPLKLRKEKRIIALSEFGGGSFSIKGHRTKKRTYGYRRYFSKKAMTKGYEKLMEREIIANIDKGLAVSIYTQLSDIEEEVNGIITYDR